MLRACNKKGLHLVHNKTESLQTNTVTYSDFFVYVQADAAPCRVRLQCGNCFGHISLLCGRCSRVLWKQVRATASTSTKQTVSFCLTFYLLAYSAISAPVQRSVRQFCHCRPCSRWLRIRCVSGCCWLAHVTSEIGGTGCTQIIMFPPWNRLIAKTFFFSFFLSFPLALEPQWA
jgi:hypothetical protein